MKPCPACHADAAKPRVGSLGESKGVWCTQCGHATDTAEEWETRADAWSVFNNLVDERKPYVSPNATRWPTQPPAGLYNAGNATSPVLDWIARMVADPRRPGETDAELRARLERDYGSWQTRVGAT